MNVEKKDLDKSQVELNIELSWEELQPYIEEGARELSQEVEIEGFRKGSAPVEVVKQKVGEMSVLDKAARIAVNKTLDKAIAENLSSQPIGQPKVDITKLSPNNPMAYKAVLSLLPEVKLGDYKNHKIEKEKEKVEEGEIDKTLEQLRENQTKENVVDREIKDGDKVVVDIDMSIDGVGVEGGQSKDTAVVMGKEYLVPGFDKNLLGAKKGEELNFQIDYPEEHHQKNLAGKKVDFKTKVKEVYELEKPELNDEFAQKFGFKTLQELKDTLEGNIAQEKKQQSEQKTEMKMIEEILAQTEFGDIPDVLLEDEAGKMLGEMEQNVTSQGGKFEDYLGSIKKTKEQLKEELKPEAEKRVKIALLIREIGQKEGVGASKEEVDEKQKELLEQYKGYEKVEERVKEPSYRAYLENIIVNNKVVQKLKDWNLVSEQDSQSSGSKKEDSDNNSEENSEENADNKKEEDSDNNSEENVDNKKE